MSGSPMRRVSLRNLLAHKVRLLLTLISVILGTAFIAGSFVFTDTLKHSFDKILSTAYQGVDAHVQPKKDYDVGVPTSLIPQIQAVPGVKAVQPEVSAPIVLVDSHGKKVQSGGAPSQGGAWSSSTGSVGPVPTMLSGHAPAAAGQVVLNEGAAKKAHLVAGDRAVVISPYKGIVPVTITGIYKTKTETGGYVGVFFTESQALQLFTDGTHVNAVDVAATAGVSQRTLTDRIAALLPADLEVRTGKQARQDIQDQVTTALSFVTYILVGFGVIGLVVGTFIIYNTFSMLVAQRLRELALLRAIGADRKQIRRSVLMEAAIIGVIGSALGLAAGVGLAYGLSALLDALGTGLPSGGLVLTGSSIVTVLIVGTGVTMLSAYAPARRAGRVPPVAAMREEFASSSGHSLKRRTTIGAGLLVVGAAFTVLGAVSSSGGTGALLTLVGLVGVGVGALLASPVLAGWVITPLGMVVGKPFGSIGRMARTNAVRNPRRTAATAFALTLGLLIVSGVGVIGSSFKASINTLFDNNVTADYILTTQSQIPVPIPATDAARQVAGVQSLTEFYGLSASVDGRHDFGSGVDGPLSPVIKVDVTKGGGQPTGTSMLVSQKVADERGWTVGSTHTLTATGFAPVTVTVSGIYKDDQLLGPWMVSGDIYRSLTPKNQWGAEVGLVHASPGVDQAALGQRLDDAVNSFYIVNVQNRDQFKGQIAAQVNGLVALVYGLLGLAIVIAILGIINTLALSVVERRREIGMLRAVGMQRKQVRRTIYLESLLIAVFGAALGLVLGIAYGTLFAHTLKGQGLTTLSVPWGQSVVFLVVAAIVGVLAALWPGIRAARTRPLEAITSE